MASTTSAANRPEGHRANTMAPIDCVRSFCRAWTGPDLDAVIAHLADDILYHNIPMEPLRGVAAVAQYLRSAGPFDSCAWELVSIAADGNIVLTERVDRMTVRGAPIALPVMGAFRVEAGCIREWRDYFDLASYRAQFPGGAASGNLDGGNRE